MYNLTEKQKETLRWIVQEVREGNLTEEFSFLYLASDDIRFIGKSIGKGVPIHPPITDGILRALMSSGLVLMSTSDRGNKVHCTLLGKAFEAVDSNFLKVADTRSSPFSYSIFGPPDKKLTYELFVLMSFAPDLRPIYDDHIKKVAGTLNLSIARADNFFSQNSIMQDVWSAIAQASIVIAECTGKNPNVFYEIGLAHAVGKPVILITQNPDDVPFDLRHRRYIQ